MTLLHLGPGFANGIANFHNARRARSAILNVIGEHATWHQAADPPLASDIASLARPVSGWLRTARASADLGRDTAEAIAAARTGMVATLIAAQDVQLGASSRVDAESARSAEAATQPSVSAAGTLDEPIERCAQRLRGSGKTALFLGGDALSLRGLRAASRIATASGSPLWCDTFPARLERGGDLPRVNRLPYFPEQAIEALSEFSAIVLAGTRSPVSFFGYPGVPSQIAGKACELIELAGPADAAASALENLADALGENGHKAGEGVDRGAGDSVDRGASDSVDRPQGELTPDRIAAVLAALQPEGAIVVDEGLTAGLAYFDAASAAPPHTYLALTGGAIGQGLPSATGAAIACPDRPVIALQADGSGMYTLQALWTQARESLDVTNVILANRGYRILDIELARAGASKPGPLAAAMARFDPVPDWTQLARGFGVPAVRVSNAEELWKEFARALAEPGPHLIEALV
jgi:acetolactate synthase-1/2/3 large subunit